jgi:hypothetical protein
MVGKYDYHNRGLVESYYDQRPKKKKSRLGRVLFFLIVFAFIIALFIYVFPEVEVTIVPKTETVQKDFEVTVKAGATTEEAVNNVFPAELITEEERMEKVFKTTGEKNIGEKAKGEVVFFNQTGLTQPLTTENKLVTDKGIVFYVEKNIDVPKAEVSAEGNIVYGSATVNIVAGEAGEEGNIEPGRLTIIDLPFSKQNKIYGEVKTRLAGGTSKMIKVVSEDDLKKAEEEMKTEIVPKLKDKITSRLGEEYTLNDKLMEYNLVSVEKTVELEEEIEEFKMAVTFNAKALVWREDLVRQMVKDKIEKESGAGKKLIETSKDIFEIEVTDFNLAENTAKLKIHTENQISMPIDTEKIKDEIKGLTEFEARRLLLSKDNIKDVRFKFNYSIMSKIPDNGNRIIVKLSF